MMTLFNKHFLKESGLLAALLVTLLTPGLGRADVLAGYDIFQSNPLLSNEAGIYFQGVPIGDFNFGGSIGVKNVGNADTIIYRDTLVPTGPDSGTAALTVKDLQLITTQPLDLAGMFGLTSNTGYYYATLDPSKVSFGSMTINGANDIGAKTFSSTLTLYLDFSVCTSVSANSCGATVFREEISLTSSDIWNIWSRGPNPLYSTGPLTGVDYLLNGINTAADFWPNVIYHKGTALVNAPTDTSYTTPIAGPLPVIHDSVPEPSSFALFGAGLALFGYSRRKTAIRAKLIAA